MLVLNVSNVIRLMCLMAKITIKLFQEGLFEEISNVYDRILNDLYKNIQLYK